MDRVGIRELKQNASAVAARVSAGESLIVTDRGRPVMRLVPYRADAFDELVAAGVIVPGTQDFNELPERSLIDGTPISEEIINARSDERY